MGESFKSEKTIRKYLLGRVSDEATLEGLEELLFTDEEFCSRVALAEDELINDYVLGYLNEEDAAAFDAVLAPNPERRFKLELTRALREKALAASARESKASKESKESKPMTAMGETMTKTTAAAEAGPSLVDSLKAFFRRPAYAGAFAVLVVAFLAASV